MPSLANHQSNEFTKLLIEGDSGSGKTGALASLVGAGYKLRILDFDNGLETLKNYVLKDWPHLLDTIEYRTLQDDYKATATGPIIKGVPKAWVDGVRMLDRWKYDDVDLGVPAEWGPDCILVIDSLTFMSDAAFDYHEAMLDQQSKGKFDGRMVYYNAQKAVEKILAMLKSDGMRTNVIVNTHIRYVEQPEGGTKGYPTSVGSALNPEIPRYFNSVASCRTQAGGKRTIQTVATALLDLKNPKPFAMAPSYDLSDGLAKFFAVLRSPPAAAKPRAVASTGRRF